MCGANGNINPQPIPASGSSCSTDNDCFDPNIFQCLNGHCQLRPCSSDSDCQESNNPTGSYKCIGPSGSSYCLDTNVCLGITYSASGQSFTPTGLVNPVCTPNNQTTMCALRDASAYVANKCDGQNSCNITIEDFGPYPCSFQPVGCNLDTSDTSVQDFTSARNTTYCQLPFSYGYPGGVPSNSSGQSSPGNANIGYTVHGIYTCVPQNE
jgi:hypothetical protein